MKRKKLISGIICLIFILAITACGNKTDDGNINMPFSSNDLDDMVYDEAVKKLEESGFTNVSVEPIYDLVTGWLTKDGEIKDVTIDENIKTFSRDERYAPNTKIVVAYHTFLPEESTETEVESVEELDTEVTSIDSTEEATVIDNNSILSEENCSDLTNMLAASGEINPLYEEFATKYKDQIVEFNGHIEYVTNHGDYSTRWDILLSYGDWVDENTVSSGPIFKFNDVGLSELGIKDLYLPDFVSVGNNIYIKANVESYDKETGIFYLKPLLIEAR